MSTRRSLSDAREELVAISSSSSFLSLVSIADGETDRLACESGIRMKDMKFNLGSDLNRMVSLNSVSLESAEFGVSSMMEFRSGDMRKCSVSSELDETIPMDSKIGCCLGSSRRVEIVDPFKDRRFVACNDTKGSFVVADVVKMQVVGRQSADEGDEISYHSLAVDHRLKHLWGAGRHFCRDFVIVDADTLKVVHRQKHCHEADVDYLAYGNMRSLVLSMSDDGSIGFWDSKNPSLLIQKNDYRSVSGLSQRIACGVFVDELSLVVFSNGLGLRILDQRRLDQTVGFVEGGKPCYLPWAMARANLESVVEVGSDGVCYDLVKQEVRWRREISGAGEGVSTLSAFDLDGIWDQESLALMEERLGFCLKQIVWLFALRLDVRGRSQLLSLPWIRVGNEGL